MADYDDTNRGVLFVNDKGDNEKRPDYRGTINVGGMEYEISGWKRTSSKGTKFLSLSVREKADSAPRDYGKGGKADHSRAAAHDDFDDDIDF